jgi:hypothetical protein
MARFKITINVDIDVKDDQLLIESEGITGEQNAAEAICLAMLSVAQTCYPEVHKGYVTKIGRS